MTYTHLTQDERYQIAILAKAEHDQSAFAQVMNRHKSTISRALRRNRGRLAEQGLPPFKTAQAVSDAMISMLTPFAARVHTLTTDNDKECAQPAGSDLPQLLEFIIPAARSSDGRPAHAGGCDTPSARQPDCSS